MEKILCAANNPSLVPGRRSAKTDGSFRCSFCCAQLRFCGTCRHRRLWRSVPPRLAKVGLRNGYIHSLRTKRGSRTVRCSRGSPRKNPSPTGPYERGGSGPGARRTLKKSSWWTTQQLGSAPAILLVRVVLPPLVTLRGETRLAGAEPRAPPAPISRHAARCPPIGCGFRRT